VNPWGILLIGIGLIMIVIGFKGSQHKVIAAFKGTKSAAGAGNTNTAPAAPTQNLPPGVTLA
jgi:hypothetical protein